MITTFFLLVVLLVAGLLLYARTRPDEFHVERRLLIQATPETLHGYIHDMQQFNRWNPFARKDPKMQGRYSGPAAGPGARYEFQGQSKNVGSGSLEIKASAPREIAMRLDMTAPMQASNSILFTLTPQAGGTEVRWSIRGACPYIAKLMSLVFNMETMIGRDFEAGLASLQALVEAGAAHADPREIVSSRHFAYVRTQLWAVFADPVRLARWWGPAGFRNTFEHFAFEPGGQWRFVMHGPDGKDYPNHSEFQTVEAPARIVFEHKNAPHFFMHIMLSEEAGGTRLHWRMRFDDAATRDAVARYALPANEENFDRLQAELGRGL